jgi:hypothetical protein
MDMLKDIADVRPVSEVKARFIIVDGRQVTFNLLDDESVAAGYDVGIWVNTEFFAGALQGMFETVWNQKPVTVQ